MGLLVENAENFGLLVVDIQGKLARIVHNSDTMLNQTRKLIQCCQVLSVPIITLEQNPQGLGPTVPELADLLAGIPPIEKYHFNGLQESPVRQALSDSGITNWLVVGIEAHICVYQTVKGLLENQLTPIVVTDCISSQNQSTCELAMTKMQQMGVTLTSMEMCIFELLGSSKHPEFRKILSIIKT